MCCHRLQVFVYAKTCKFFCGDRLKSISKYSELAARLKAQKIIEKNSSLKTNINHYSVKLINDEEVVLEKIIIRANIIFFSFKAMFALTILFLLFEINLALTLLIMEIFN